MRVLLTNNSLDARAGSELYVRDVAVGLLRRGHRPVVFSRRLGAVADELRAATVPVVDDLACVAERPDLIHGQHHLETMVALLHFPGVPAVFFCHGWIPWEERPPVFPRLRRYVAVDEPCRERLVAEHGIPPGSVEVVPNFVDLERFAPRQPLPSKPRRALVFSNRVGEECHLPTIREACTRFGIALEAAGAASGRVLERPEKVLPGFDIVFGKGRSALEAMAVGAAVVVCDADGLGPMVTAAELPRLRSLNFGVRLLRRPVEADTVAVEIGRYDADDAAVVTARIRAESGLEAALDRIEAVYESALRDAPGAGEDFEAESRASSRYLVSLGPTLVRAWGVARERDQLAARLAGEQTVRAALAEAKAAAVGQSALATSRAEGLAQEVARMRATVTWRARDRLLRSRLVRLLHRIARGGA